MENVTLLAAFTAGIFSFVSPCVLPLVPAYISFISGVSIDEMRTEGHRVQALKRVSISSILFIIGFSTVFVLLGASATIIGQLLVSKWSVLTKVAGVVIIIFGLHTAGLFRIKIFDYERRFHSRAIPNGPLGSLVIGFAFAFGWTPCVGPILAAILAWAAVQETLSRGVLLLSMYSLGLGLPFFLATLIVNTFLELLGKVKGYFRAIELTAGMLLIFLGIMIFSGSISMVSSYLVK